MANELQAKGIKVHNRLTKALFTFLMVFGPGLIVMVADNDAGAVSTYVQAGAQYGKSLLWVMVLLLPLTYFVQEMVARLGIVTGQGLAASIYQKFGKGWGIFCLIDLLLVNFLTLMTEFAAINLAVTHLGVSPYVAVPIAAAGLIALVLSGGYRRWERISIFLCLLNVVWFYLAWQLPSDVISNPHLPIQNFNSHFVFLLIAIIGTTIAPWQVFFQQACVADKRLRLSDLKWSRLDTFIGACFTITMAICMMLVGDAAHNYIMFDNPAQMAQDLVPTMGKFIGIALPLLMINASILGTMAVSLSSAWAYGEIAGCPHSLAEKFRTAPVFYSVYSFCVLAAAGLVLIPQVPLQLVIVGVQVLAGVVLPPILVFLQILSTDKALLGEFVNKRWNNWVNWIIVAILFVLSFIMAVQVLIP